MNIIQTLIDFNRENYINTLMHVNPFEPVEYPD